MFSYVSLEQRVPQDHRLRAVRKLTDSVLRMLSQEFGHQCHRGVTYINRYRQMGSPQKTGITNSVSQRQSNLRGIRSDAKAVSASVDAFGTTRTPNLASGMVQLLALCNPSRARNRLKTLPQYLCNASAFPADRSLPSRGNRQSLYHRPQSSESPVSTRNVSLV